MYEICHVISDGIRTYVRNLLRYSLTFGRLITESHTWRGWETVVVVAKCY